jgi:hypothetical protein
MYLFSVLLEVILYTTYEDPERPILTNGKTNEKLNDDLLWTVS